MKYDEEVVRDGYLKGPASILMMVVPFFPSRESFKTVVLAYLVFLIRYFLLSRFQLIFQFGFGSRHLLR